MSSQDFPDFGPDHGPRRVPLDSNRGDVEFAGVFASKAFVAVSFLSKLIRWNLAKTNSKVYLSKTGAFV